MTATVVEVDQRTLRRWASNVVRERTAQQLSQRKLAAKAGVSPRTIAALETGEHAPRKDTRRRIARALHVRQDTLFP